MSLHFFLCVVYRVRMLSCPKNLLNMKWSTRSFFTRINLTLTLTRTSSPQVFGYNKTSCRVPQELRLPTLPFDAVVHDLVRLLAKRKDCSVACLSSRVRISEDEVMRPPRDYSLTHSLTHSLAHPSIHPSIRPLIHPFHLPIHSPIYQYIYSLIRLRIRPFHTVWVADGESSHT